MSATDPTTTPPAIEPKWYKTPLFGQAVGIALGLLLAWLYAKTGITPAPIPPPQPSPAVLVLTVSPQPVQPGQPIAVAAK